MTDASAPSAPLLLPIGPVVRREDVDIWSDAAMARAAAQRHLERTRGWALEAFRQERQKGYSEGYSAGAEEVARLIASLTAQAKEHQSLLERELPVLVMEVLEGLLGSFDSKDLLVRMVRHSLQSKYGSGELRLRVAPALVNEMTRQLADFDGREGFPVVTVESDPALSAEQCVLWSEFGNVDLSPRAQIRALRLGFGLPEKG